MESYDIKQEDGVTLRNVTARYFYLGNYSSINDDQDMYEMPITSETLNSTNLSL
jgi:hypothetical protein